MKKLLYSIVLISWLATNNAFGSFCCWKGQAESDENKKPEMVDAATMTDEAAIVEENTTLITKDHRNASDIATDELCSIFNFLYLEDIAEARRVNKRWHEAARQGSFNTFVFSKTQFEYDPFNVALSLRRGHKAGFRKVVIGDRTLFRWSTYSNWISVKNIRDFLHTYGHNIESFGLYIHLKPVDGNQRDNYHFDLVAEKCPKLTFLDIAGFNITCANIKEIVAQCHHLKHISILHGCDKYRHDDEYINQERINEIKKEFPQDMCIDYKEFIYNDTPSEDYSNLN